MKIFITGIGSGLGEALARLYAEAGEEVYAVSRFLPKSLEGFANLHFAPLNLHSLERIAPVVEELLGDVELDLAILNAGILGELKDMSDTSIHEIETIMNLNVYANKVLLDILKRRTVRQVVAISSGASVSGARGWNAYSLSKAALNMLVRLYAAEMPNTHLTALAPGLIETPMMEYILTHADRRKFPVVERLANSKRLDPMDAALLLSDNFSKLLEYPSGEYVDIRKIV